MPLTEWMSRCTFFDAVASTYPPISIIPTTIVREPVSRFLIITFYLSLNYLNFNYKTYRSLNIRCLTALYSHKWTSVELPMPLCETCHVYDTFPKFLISIIFSVFLICLIAIASLEGRKSIKKRQNSKALPISVVRPFTLSTSSLDIGLSASPLWLSHINVRHLWRHWFPSISTRYKVVRDCELVEPVRTWSGGIVQWWLRDCLLEDITVWCGELLEGVYELRKDDSVERSWFDDLDRHLWRIAQYPRNFDAQVGTSIITAIHSTEAKGFSY